MAKDILRLQVSMKETVFMQISESSCNLEEDRANLIFSEGPATLFGTSVNLVKVAFEVVEDEEQLRIGKNNFPELNNVGMIKLLQALDFAENVAVFYTFVFALHLLDGDNFVVWGDCSEDYSVGTIAYSFNYLIFLHQTYLL